ncbi:MAG: hypothetical protein H6576_14695 [Lewinellaceae bacterium]|nr:hypothetical protein [Lewinellaceae bacterium]
MSKKRFSEGLEDLFSDTKSSVGSLFSNEPPVATPVPERRSSHKNFMSDLDSLLQESLEESLEKLETNRTDDAIPSNKSKSGTRESSLGLDSLIRQTIDIKEIDSDENTGKRRITVAVDKSKVEQLKSIARLENAYMKDLLISLIDEYLQKYPHKKGLK